MEEENKYKGRGGKRPGAGRPRTYSKLMALRFQKDVAAYIEQFPNKSKFIQDCVIHEIKATEAARLAKLGEVIPATEINSVSLPMVDLKIVAGFPIPLDNDERSQDIDLLRMLCPHPEASYLIRVTGDSMIDADILSGDILVVDKSNREPSPRQTAVCELNGEYTVKRVVREGDRGFLMPANPKYPKIEIKPGDNFSIWGTVAYVIHKPREE